MSADQLVLGTAQLTQRYGIANTVQPLPRDDAVRLVRIAQDCNVAGIDTAPAYGDAEAVIGEAAVSTPVMTKLDTSAGDDIDGSVQRSLERLARTHLDVLFLHDPTLVVDDPTGVIERVASWVGNGVATLGASIYERSEFEAALRDERIGALQVPINLADGRLEHDLVLASRAGKLVYARSVFLQGALLLDPADLPPSLRALSPLLEAVEALSQSRGMARHDVLVAYVRDLPGVDAVILGCETIAQLRLNLLAIDVDGLPPDELERLRALRPTDVDVLDPRRWRT